MKKIILIITLITLAAGFSFAQSDKQKGLVGVWKTEPFLTEREDGLLVASEAPYAFPHLGISEIRILDSGFIIFQIGASEHRAFYEPELLDYDNIHLTCIFKNGEELVLKLVKIDALWKYFIRIPADSLLFEAERNTLPDEPADDEPAGGESADGEAESMDSEPGTDYELPDVEQRLFTGMLIKKL